eukprot:UN02687
MHKIQQKSSRAVNKKQRSTRVTQKKITPKRRPTRQCTATMMTKTKQINHKPTLLFDTTPTFSQRRTVNNPHQIHQHSFHTAHNFTKLPMGFTSQFQQPSYYKKPNALFTQTMRFMSTETPDVVTITYVEPDGEVVPIKN